MEGPLVSDTTELLSSAPGASEGAPAGTSAPSAASGASAPKSRSRGGSGGTGLSSLLMPELQRIAQSMSLPGAGRMRKGQLVEAIEARQGGAPKQEAGAASQGSNQRVASAGADPARLPKQDATEPAARTQPGLGDNAGTGIAAGPASGAISADAGTGQQLSFDQAPPAERPNGRSRRTSTPRTSTRRTAAQESPAPEAPAQQASAQQAPAQQVSGEQAPAAQAAAGSAQAQHGATQESAGAPAGVREDGQTGLRDEAATGETQRGDRRRRTGRREDQP
ncbi:MAG TPA: Rho termination factor N-terminal domain-containing protein, partial [Streptosporangiaceae bacterium]